MKKFLTASFALAVSAVLAACGTATDTSASPAVTTPAIEASATPSPSTIPSSGSTTETSTAPASSAGAYIEYETFQADKERYANHRIVYFFAASWCPSCQAAAKELEKSDGVPDGLAVVKVDYDSEKELKKTYGVTIQHTFVQVDTDGNQIDKWSGSRNGDEIKAKTR